MIRYLACILLLGLWGCDSKTTVDLGNGTDGPADTSTDSADNIQLLDECFDGNFTVHDSADLLALRAYPCIDGSLIIEGGDAAVDLPDLESITGNLTVQSSTLDTLTLAQLQSVGGSVFITHNPSLGTLAGLAPLTDLGGGLYVTYNDTLTSLTGLEGITTIEGFLSVRNNDSLSSLTGLEHIGSVSGNLSVQQNSSLTSLSGLDGVSTIGGSLQIVNNDSLISLSGLELLNTVSGIVDIFNNAALTTIAALANLTTAEEVSIGLNPQLPTCDVCGWLLGATVTGDTTVTDNLDDGCTSCPCGSCP